MILLLAISEEKFLHFLIEIFLILSKVIARNYVMENRSNVNFFLNISFGLILSNHRNLMPAGCSEVLNERNYGSLVSTAETETYTYVPN